MQAPKILFFYSKRGHEGSKYFEWYRCYSRNQQVIFSAQALSFGKPISVFKGEDTQQPIAELRNSKGYLINGKTHFQDIQTRNFFGYYIRTGKVMDGTDNTIGRWQDARSWREEFKSNLIDGIANAVFGGGDAPSGANPSDTHLFSKDQDIIATLQREQMPFFPDPPKSMEPGKLAKFASKVIPGRLGKSLSEVMPPLGWTLEIHKKPDDKQKMDLIHYAALFRIEFMRWSRA